MILEEIKENMETNGYAYYNDNAFKNKTYQICYIPENAEEINECYTYQQLFQICYDWYLENPWYSEDTKFTVDDLVNNMYQNIEWEFPHTWLDQLIY